MSRPPIVRLDSGGAKNADVPLPGGAGGDVDRDRQRELTRLREEIAVLDKDVAVATVELARASAEVRTLVPDVDRRSARLQESKLALAAAADAIKKAQADGATTVTVRNRAVTIDEAKRELGVSVQSHQKGKRELEELEAKLALRVTARDALEKNLTVLRDHRNALRDAADALDAKLRLPSHYDGRVDDAKLAEVKKQMAELQKKLAAEREGLKSGDAKGQTVDDILKGLDPKKPEPKRE